PPLATFALEAIVFQTTHLASWVGYRLIGSMKVAFALEGHKHEDIDRLAQLAPARFLTTPGLWLGLLAAAAFLVAAARLRRKPDTNRLGYRLLGKGETESAIQVFRLNVETHPGSANVRDSLGEAYLAAGNKPLALESYQKAVAIDPKMKTAVAELQRLGNFTRKPYRPMVLFHILAGSLAMLSGAVALSLRKGSRRHGVAGSVFVVCMLGLSGSGAFMAFVAPDGETINVLMGLFTFYLVATAWLTARRRTGGTGPLDWAAALVAVAVAAGLFR